MSGRSMTRPARGFFSNLDGMVRHRIFAEVTQNQRLNLWKFDSAKWLSRELVLRQGFRRWLAALDDFRNWLQLGLEARERT